MKKMILAAVAIAMAVVANAATVRWTAANIYEAGSTTTKAEGYLVYFVSSGDYSLSDATTALAGGSADFLKDYGQASQTTGSTGTASATITTTAGNRETWTGYLVILNGGSLSEASLAFITPEASKTTGASGQQANITFTALTGTQDKGNWYAVGVPEPTSGLLLLLGVAGLALKRKHA